MAQKKGVEPKIPNKEYNAPNEDIEYSAQSVNPEKCSSGFKNFPREEVFLTGANELAMHNGNPDTEHLDLHHWKMKNFYMDSEVLQLPIKLISKQTLCKMIGLLCSELQTSRQPDVKSCQTVDNDLTVKDQERRTHRRSSYDGKIKCSDFRPIRKMKPCSFCSEIHLWGKSRCPSFGRRCNYCGIFNHNSISCWFQQMDNFKQAEMGNVVETKTRNLEAQITLEKEAVKLSDSSTVKSLETPDLDKPLALSEEPHGENCDKKIVDVVEGENKNIQPQNEDRDFEFTSVENYPKQISSFKINNGNFGYKIGTRIKKLKEENEKIEQNFLGLKSEWKWFLQSGLLEDKSPKEKRDAFIKLADTEIKSKINEIDPDGKIKDVDMLIRKVNDSFKSKFVPGKEVVLETHSQTTNVSSAVEISEDAQEEDFDSREIKVDTNSEIVKMQENNGEKSSQNEDSGNISAFEEKWLLATIATADDPQWFESQSVRQTFIKHGGLLLAKFIEKFKEVKKVENQKNSS